MDLHRSGFMLQYTFSNLAKTRMRGASWRKAGPGTGPPWWRLEGLWQREATAFNFPGLSFFLVFLLKMTRRLGKQLPV